MPSLSALLRRSSKRDSVSSVQSQSQSQDATTNGKEKLQRRDSKRDFLRGLLKRSSLSSARRTSTQMPVTTSTSPVPQAQETPPPTMPNPNKPLPPAPVAEEVENEKLEELPVAPVKNLQRIMSPITREELEELFSGAPQFFARSDSHHAGVPEPSVAFPWNDVLQIRGLSDHIGLHDKAWGSMTVTPHLTGEVNGSNSELAVTKIQFSPRCTERPNMLSMQGLERGTIGFTAALELAVADSLREESEDYEPGKVAESIEIFRRRTQKKQGLREVSDLILGDALIDVSAAYHNGDERPGIALYSDLFAKLLFPPARLRNPEDPYSLEIQIEALINVLALPHIWMDFSLVESRIMLGQILNGHATKDVHAETQNPDESDHDKYWLLLQILLSCELLLRLDRVTKNTDADNNPITSEQILQFDKRATNSVRWSLVLARRWLENVSIERPRPPTPENRPATWLGSLKSAVGQAAAADGTLDGEVDVNSEVYDIENLKIEGRHPERQIEGLLHFARKLKWPNLDDLVAKVKAHGITVAEASQTSTPAVGTPRSFMRRSTSYFSSERPTFERQLSRSQKISALMQPEGWLSKTYLSGLVLPGECLGHFLVSSLLENDTVAISKLGMDACLYGGFRYSNRSFWSKESVVGRVLAAGKGARECVGWISSPVLPKGAGEQWVDLEVEEPDNNPNPRIKNKQDIERSGNVIGGADISSILPGDFILPSDEPEQSQAFTVSLESLDLFTSDTSVPGSPVADGEYPTPNGVNGDEPAIKTYHAMMRFLLNIDGEDQKEMNVDLKYNIHFVTAFPCVASRHTEVLKPQGHPPSPQLSPKSLKSSTGGHPLHKAFTYTTIPLSSLIHAQHEAFDALLTSPTTPTNSTTHTTNSTIPKVLVIDCADRTALAFPVRPTSSPAKDGIKQEKYGSDLEMLARAVCAERGWNAVVSRRGRGCLSCAIRESGALGWRVVIRLR